MLLGYLWTPILQPLVGSLSRQKKHDVAQSILHALDTSVVFSDTQKAVYTASNLNYSMLEKMAASICLDVTPLSPCKRRLDALVNLRNQIAHGAKHKALTRSDFENHAATVMALMETFEQVLISAIHKRAFCAA